jgi:hypothetical protein
VSRAAHVFFSGCFGKRDDDLPPAYDPTIGLCDKLKGSKVHIEGTLVSGTGSVLGDSPVLQDKAYFELTIRTEGTFAVGVATKDTPLEGVISHEKVPTAWTLTSNMQSLPPLPAGSTLGVALDQGDFPVQVYFYLDGKVVHQVSGIRGEVLPAFSVANGAVVEPNFGQTPYAQGMPMGFQGIIKSMSLL